MNRVFSCLMVAAALATPQAGSAQDVPSSDLFGAAPIGDLLLSSIRGGQSPFASLTADTLGRLVEDNGRADLGLAGSVGRIQMDVWWGTVGSEAIAQSVRAGGER